jgi:4-amino-4-deoxy-L-arabinose transferase-like glycosyltransferase
MSVIPVSTHESAGRFPEARRTRVLLVGAWLTWIVCSAVHWTSGAPLGHDEARYAIASRDLLAGDDARWAYVPPGMQVIAMPGVAGGGGERALRLLPVLLSLLFLLVLERIARAVGTRETAAWTVALAAATGPLVRLSSDVLSDIPSTGLLLVTAFLVFRELARPDGPTRVILWAPVAGAAAFYVRYGSCIPLAIIAGLAVVGTPRGIVRRPLLVVATLALFVLLLAPHLIHSQLTTGSPLGTLRLSATVPKGFGKGLAEYAAHPVRYLGVFTVVLLPLSFAANHRVRLLLVALAVLDVLSLGIQTSAQARYVFLATSLILVAGPAAVARLRAPRIAANVALAAVVLGWAFQIRGALQYRQVRVDGMSATILAAAAIRDDNRGAPCYVLGRHDTQLEWYTGCEYALVLPAQRTKPLYAVWDNTGGPWQPAIASLPPSRSVLHVPGVVEVVRLR